jgi:outer membrane protein
MMRLGEPNIVRPWRMLREQNDPISSFVSQPIQRGSVMIAATSMGIRLRGIIAACLAAGFVWSPPAQSQSMPEQALSQEGLESNAAGSPWRVALGAGLVSASKYRGASSDRIRIRPMFLVTYKNRLFFGPLGLGLTAVRSGGFRAGAILGYEGGRSAKIDTALAGLGDISASASVGLFASYRNGPFDISGTIRKAVSHSDNGVSGLLRLSIRHPFTSTRLELIAGPELQYGNSQYETTWFGVTASQSAASRLPVFSPHAGVNAVGVHATLIYRLQNRWLLHAFLDVRGLTGDAANSPIVQRKTERLIGAGAAYHFGR